MWCRPERKLLIQRHRFFCNLFDDNFISLTFWKILHVSEWHNGVIRFASSYSYSGCVYKQRIYEDLKEISLTDLYPHYYSPNANSSTFPRIRAYICINFLRALSFHFCTTSNNFVYLQLSNRNIWVALIWWDKVSSKLYS